MRFWANQLSIVRSDTLRTSASSRLDSSRFGVDGTPSLLSLIAVILEAPRASFALLSTIILRTSGENYVHRAALFAENDHDVR
jgi:hypothetical protein